MPGNSYILRNFQLKASSLMNGTSWAMRNELSFAAHLVDFWRRLFEFLSTFHTWSTPETNQAIQWMFCVFMSLSIFWMFPFSRDRKPQHVPLKWKCDGWIAFVVCTYCNTCASHLMANLLALNLNVFIAMEMKKVSRFRTGNALNNIIDIIKVFSVFESCRILKHRHLCCNYMLPPPSSAKENRLYVNKPDESARWGTSNIITTAVNCSIGSMASYFSICLFLQCTRVHVATIFINIAFFSVVLTKFTIIVYLLSARQVMSTIWDIFTCLDSVRYYAVILLSPPISIPVSIHLPTRCFNLLSQAIKSTPHTHTQNNNRKKHSRTVENSGRFYFYAY